MLKAAPKDPYLNARYRRAILERASGDKAFQNECWMRCKRDVVWFIDTFAWTVNPMDYPLCPDRPFVLWGYQEKIVKKLSDSIGKNDILMEKSRKMGATWVSMAVLIHLWLFSPKEMKFLLGSNKEDNVANLFGMLRYLVDKLPGWLRPIHTSLALKITNNETNSFIEGESTNDNFARSKRYTAIFMDEFAAVERGEKLLSATQQSSKTRWFVSTHQGVNTTFYAQRQKMAAENPERVLRIHWTEHPEYRKGLYTSVRGPDGRPQLQVLDHDYPWPKAINGNHLYPFVVDEKYEKPRSPWYDEECRRSPNDQIIAQEIDIEAAKATTHLIDPDKLEIIVARSAKPPATVGEISFSSDGQEPRLTPNEVGRLRLWCPLDKEGRPPPGRYGNGNDIAMGTGGDKASNSVSSVVNLDSGQKVAEFCTHNLLPQDFAVYAVALCRFFHDAKLIFEDTGPGAQFATRLRELRYWNCAKSFDNDAKVKRKQTENIGWHPSKESKRLLLDNYAYDLQNGFMENPSREALQEISEYERQTNGEIVHVKASKSLNPNTAGEAHGDRVIADALANLLLGGGVRKRKESPLPAETPASSFAARRNSFLRRRKQLRTRY